MNTLLLLLACAQPPVLSSVEPTSGPPGTVLVLQGEHLSADAAVRLAGQPLEDLVVTPPGRAEGKVPAGLPAGKADLLVETAAGRVSRNGAFVVQAPPAQDPCSGEEKRFTHIPPDGSVVKIDRHLPGGEVDRSQVKVHEVQGVRVERTLQQGKACAAIWLDTSGGPVLFDAQVDADLRPQAQTIANGLHKPLTVGEHVEVVAPTTP
ncbi:IPT/TIG domain-containing protein [Myxococcota bacterium]|nr:IPT/TIG domain-containing protein [Myxococcota bacterium]